MLSRVHQGLSNQLVGSMDHSLFNLPSNYFTSHCLMGQCITTTEATDGQMRCSRPFPNCLIFLHYCTSRPRAKDTVSSIMYCRFFDFLANSRQTDRQADRQNYSYED
eukprot:scaffold18841_cov58-Attheya_sp.AAC.4